jgi:2-amino-4-hydroxy-6-hydroxymethyldihydropteridine diphosphokinase
MVRGNKKRTRVYISLGSNQGDRVGFIQQAVQLFKDNEHIRIIECSSLYETQPVGSDSSEWFINAVAAIETDLSAMDLLAICRSIEERLLNLRFAEKLPANANKQKELGRIIDIDILFYGDKIIENDDLQIPHPMIQKRAYTLVPLLEIAPELMHPKLNKTIAQLHEELPLPELIYLYGTREEE